MASPIEPPASSDGPEESSQGGIRLVEMHFCSSCGRTLNGSEDPNAALLCTFARNHDSQAVATLIASKQRDFLRIATNWCREWELPPHWAEDVVQMTLIKIVQKAERFDCTKPAWPWLATILKRTFLDFSRRGSRLRCKRLKLEPLSDEPTFGVREPSDHPQYEPPRAALFNERNELLDRAIDSLPNRERAVFLARRAGTSNQEVARNLQCSESTACALYGNAVAKLRDVLR